MIAGKSPVAKAAAANVHPARQRAPPTGACRSNREKRYVKPTPGPSMG